MVFLQGKLLGGNISLGLMALSLSFTALVGCGSQPTPQTPVEITAVPAVVPTTQNADATVSAAGDAPIHPAAPSVSAAAAAATTSAAVAAASGSTGGPKFSCSVQKTGSQFIASVTQDIFRRIPTATELAMASGTGFSASSFVDYALAQNDFMQTGIPFFVNGLLRLPSNLLPNPKLKGSDAALIADLQKEPIVLVQKNLTQPWGDLFTTQNIYCSALTAPLYGAAAPAGGGFGPCTMQSQRAGLLGLVSVLRGYSSAFYTNNNNYHRNALAVYLSQGIQLASATNGPSGTGTPEPLPSCVPALDTRKTAAGAPFGTQAVPASGAVCASCHVPYHAEMVGAFLNFDVDGSILTANTINGLSKTTTLGVSPTTLNSIMTASQNSCWSVAGPTTTPVNYTGQPGFGALIAASPILGNALAVQIQTDFMNRTPDPSATAQTAAAFNANGKTLPAALKGYLLSDAYQCETPTATP